MGGLGSILALSAAIFALTDSPPSGLLAMLGLCLDCEMPLKLVFREC
jgi:hypothetical protein